MKELDKGPHWYNLWCDEREEAKQKALRSSRIVHWGGAFIYLCVGLVWVGAKGFSLTSFLIATLIVVYLIYRKVKHD